MRRNPRITMATAVALGAALLLQVVGLGLPAAAADPTVRTISGRVVDEATGQPLQSVLVTAHNLGSTSAGNRFSYTDANGRYSINYVADTVRLSFAPQTNHAPENWDDRRGSDYTPIVFGSDTARENIDAALAPGGSISGTVQGAPGELSFFATPYVRVFSTTTGAEAGSVRVYLNGESPWSYRVAQLPEDTYRVEFARDLDRIVGAGQYWPNVPDSAGAAAAGTVTVGYAQQVSGIDAQLTVGGTIKGRVLDSNGGGYGCNVHATSADGSLSPRWESADLNGDFTITGLSTGAYRLSTTAEGGCKVVYYSDSTPSGTTTDPAAASTVPVTQGQTSTVPADMVVELPTLPHTSKPSISGNPGAGLPLTATAGTWAGNVYHTQVRWFVDDEVVPGATDTTFVPSAEHTGREIRVEYDARAGGFARSLVKSDPVVIEDTTPLGPPSGLRLDVSRLDHGMVNVSWEPGLFAPGTSPAYIVVLEHPDRPGELIQMSGLVTEGTSVQISGEHYDSVYDLRVVAVGPAGQYSEPSNLLTVTTHGQFRPPAFSDVPRSHAFIWQILWLASTGITTGYAEAGGATSFRPGQPVLREQMAAFLHRFAGSPVQTAPAPIFSDVSHQHPFNVSMRWLASVGITTGYANPDGNPAFQPSAPVLREQMAAFLYRFATWVEGKAPSVDTSGPSPFIDVPKSHTFYREILWLSKTGVTTGYDEPGGKRSFRPSQPVLREQMAAFLYRFDQQLPDRRIELS